MQHVNFLALLFLVASLQAGTVLAQGRASVSLGAGFLHGKTAGNDSTALSGTPAFSLGIVTPVLRRQGFSLGIGLVGEYASGRRDPSSPFLPFAVAGGTTLSSGSDVTSASQRALRIGAGPEVEVKLGKNMLLTPKLHVGFARMDRDGFSFRQRVEYGKETYEREIHGQDRVASSGLFYAPKLRLSVPLGKRLSVWAEASYAFQRVDLTERTVQFAGPPDEDGAYAFGSWVEARAVTRQRSVAWNTPTSQVGLSLAIGNAGPGKAGNDRRTDRKQLDPKHPGPQQGTEQANPRRRLIATAPANNASYRNAKEIQSLQWQLIGSPIPSPTYVVELIHLDNNRKPQRTYMGKSVNASIAIDAFTGADLPEGQYHWRVTETTTGSIAGTRAFSISNCAIDLAIENDTIECLGYEGSDRKYRICFDASYASTSGDLTYNDPVSGLFAYDQHYNPLTYTLTGQNTGLVDQPGASPSTVHYCVEVTVPSGVTAIGLALQGDDLDPSPVLCQPGVSLMVDSLPDCLCDDCDALEVAFGDFDITAQDAQGTQYTFAGDITVNQPIYGVEVQVLSYHYQAHPGGCAAGVNGVETSGVIFPAASTINGAGNLQATGAVSKIVRHLGTTPMDGSIPMQLVIGLPGTLPGFDPICCAISYEVCLKVNVLYEDGSCKACSFTHCFQFDNQ